MARIRTVKPEFFSNEELAKCTPHARLLAIALLQLVDSEGRMRWIPSQVIAHAFPWETLDLSPMIHELCSVKYLELYVVNGREYAHIPAFNVHQRITGKEAQCKSKFPPIDQADTEGKPECFPVKHLDAQEQGNKGTREQGTQKRKTHAHFDAFWSVYPNKKDKKKARALWGSRNLDNIADILIADVKNRISNDDQWKKGFIPMPTTYINGDRWDDSLMNTESGGTGAWHETASGVEAKAAELNIIIGDREPWPNFKFRVLKAAGIDPK